MISLSNSILSVLVRFLFIQYYDLFTWHNDKLGSYHQQQKEKPDKYVKTRLYLLYLLHLSSFLSIRLFIWQK